MSYYRIDEMDTRFSTHRWRSVLMFLLLAMLGGCQSSTAVNTLFPTPTIAPGRIFFIRSESVQNGYQDHCDNLWSMYPDGSRLRQHTNDTPPGIGYHIPDDGSVALLFASATPVTLDTDLVQQVLIPEECQTPPFSGHTNSRVFDFSFSDSGRYVSFIVGSYECGGSVLRIFDKETETCFDVQSSDKLVQWLSGDRALVSMERCEYGTLSLYDPSTAQLTFLGYGSIKEWNRDGTAFFAAVTFIS